MADLALRYRAEVDREVMHREMIDPEHRMRQVESNIVSNYLQMKPRSEKPDDYLTDTRKCVNCNTLYREIDNLGPFRCWTHTQPVVKGYYSCCNRPANYEPRGPNEPYHVKGCTRCHCRDFESNHIAKQARDWITLVPSRYVEHQWIDLHKDSYIRITDLREGDMTGISPEALEDMRVEMQNNGDVLVIERESEEQHFAVSVELPPGTVRGGTKNGPRLNRSGGRAFLPLTELRNNHSPLMKPVEIEGQTDADAKFGAAITKQWEKFGEADRYAHARPQLTVEKGFISYVIIRRVDSVIDAEREEAYDMDIRQPYIARGGDFITHL